MAAKTTAKKTFDVSKLMVSSIDSTKGGFLINGKYFFAGQFRDMIALLDSDDQPTSNLYLKSSAIMDSDSPLVRIAPVASDVVLGVKGKLPAKTPAKKASRK